MQSPDPRVQLDLPHRVRFTRHAFAPDNPTLRDALVGDDTPPNAKLLVVADQGLVSARPGLQDDIRAYAAAAGPSFPSIVGFRALPGAVSYTHLTLPTIYSV